VHSWAREHSVAVRNRCWVQDRLWSGQSCPHPTLTRRLVIKPLCGNPGAYFRSRNSVRVVRSRTATESERCSFGSRFSVMLLHNWADFVIKSISVPETPSTRMHLLTEAVLYGLAFSCELAKITLGVDVHSSMLIKLSLSGYQLNGIL